MSSLHPYCNPSSTALIVQNKRLGKTLRLLMFQLAIYRVNKSITEEESNWYLRYVIYQEPVKQTIEMWDKKEAFELKLESLGIQPKQAMMIYLRRHGFNDREAIIEAGVRTWTSSRP